MTHINRAWEPLFCNDFQKHFFAFQSTVYHKTGNNIIQHMQKNTNIDKKIPVTMRVTGYFRNIKVLNSGGGQCRDLKARPFQNAFSQ